MAARTTEVSRADVLQELRGHVLVVLESLEDGTEVGRFLRRWILRCGGVAGDGSSAFRFLCCQINSISSRVMPDICMDMSLK